MKKFALALMLGGLMAAPAFAADPIVGTWQTKKDDNGNFGFVQIAPCGAKFCGTLIKSFDNKGAPMDSPNIGKKIVWDMVAKGDGHYGNGKVWSPDRDKTYDSKLTLHDGNKLDVTGCIMAGLLCRNGGTWTRVK